MESGTPPGQGGYGAPPPDGSQPGGPTFDAPPPGAPPPSAAPPPPPPPPPPGNVPPPSYYAPPQGGQPPPDAGRELVKRLSLPIHQAKVWLYLLGILSMLSGVFSALTIVGIVFAWLPIWMGVLLMQSASAVEQSQLTGDEAALHRSLDKLKLYFTITGVTTLLGMVLAVLAFSLGFYGAVLDYLNP